MPSGDPYRVMVVDDSAVIRGLLARGLESDPEIKVIASASNGELAIKSLARHDVEIIVLDIEMPVMDGITALPLLLKAKPGVQIVMASTLTRHNAEISLKAMEAGAADYVAKPSSTSQIHSTDAFKRELIEKVKAVAQAGRGARRESGTRPAGAPAGGVHTPVKSLSPTGPLVYRPTPRARPEIVAIGSSTGGPPALFTFLSDLCRDVSLPIVITQHMPATFTSLLAEHITRACKVPAAEGKNGECVLPGRIYIAPGGYHMLVERGKTHNTIRIDSGAPENFCKPAVDPMLRSMAPLYGPRMLVVMLTGMGHDGRGGSQIVTAAGGFVIAQDEATSVVWGMPGAVATAGLCSAVLPIKELAPYVRKLVLRSAA